MHIRKLFLSHPCVTAEDISEFITSLEFSAMYSELLTSQTISECGQIHSRDTFFRFFFECNHAHIQKWTDFAFSKSFLLKPTEKVSQTAD
jgi:hypothetical protein